MGEPIAPFAGVAPHQYAMASVPEIIGVLTGVFSVRQVAAMVTVDASTVHRWRNGAKTPLNSTKESTLRTIAHVFGLLEVCGPETTRSWFLTPNQRLTYATPAAHVAEHGREVLAAAEEFAAQHSDGQAKVG